MLTDIHNPYEILGIEKTADRKTIKRAYAKLVKQYHPEEQPEEWKRIHDAYEYAMKSASEPKQKPSAVPESMEQPQNPGEAIGTPDRREPPAEAIETPEKKQAPYKPTEMPQFFPSTPVESNRTREDEERTIFDDIEAVADQQREEEKIAEEERLKSAIHEVQSLSWQNNFKLKEWKKFFDQENLLPVISQKKFLRELGDCFFLKQINEKLYTYMNEQLDIITGYIKIYGPTDSTRSMDIASVEYARSKIKVAYKTKKQGNKPNFKGFSWAAILTANVVLTVFLRYMVTLDNQRKEQDRLKRQQQTQEWMIQQNELQKQNQIEVQEWMKDSFEANPQMQAEFIQRLQEMLEEGTITRESYDIIMQQYGFDSYEEETP